MTVLVLRITGLSVVYRRGAHAVRGVDLEVEPEQCLALVGESGCGKSTIARAVLGLLPTTASVSGSVKVLGTDVLGLSERNLRRLRGVAVGYVAQDPFSACDPLRTVAHHVAEAWTARGRRPDRTTVIERLRELRVPDPERSSRQYPHTWSGGMLQRASIAAATAHAPPLLVADEPTSALDHDLAHNVLGAILREGSAVLLITHDLGLVARHADHVAIMYAGRIVEGGPVQAVLDAPRHPYTRALLAAVPRPGNGLPQELPGEPPSRYLPDRGPGVRRRRGLPSGGATPCLTPPG
ncbi:MAG: ABC transporter ATP-binding protein [Egibacteraceae bacterium]